MYKYYIADWVKACEDLKIPICGVDAKLAVCKFQNFPASTELENECPEYTKEAFTDAIAEFVVGDDQVCNQFISQF